VRNLSRKAHFIVLFSVELPQKLKGYVIMERDETGRLTKDTNKSVVSYKLTDSTKLKLRSVMQMMSVNNSVNYDEMFSFLADFYIENGNINIQKRRKKLTEQKGILEKLEGKIERKLEKIYKNQMVEMWNYLSKFEKRENYHHDKILEIERGQNIELKRTIKDINESIQTLIENEPLRQENLKEIFSEFKYALGKISDNSQKQNDKNTEQTIEYIEQQMQKIVQFVRIGLDLETASEKRKRISDEKAKIQKAKQEEAKIRVEKERESTRIRAEAEEKRKIEESKQLRWFNSDPGKTTIVVKIERTIATKGFLGKITYDSEIVDENLTYDDVEVLYRQCKPSQKIRLYKDKTPPTEQKPAVVVYELDGKEIKREKYESEVAFGNTKKRIFDKFDDIFWDIEILAKGDTFHKRSHF
jgi:hypothetical protein